MNSKLHLSNADLKYWINEFPVLENNKTVTKKIQIPMRVKSHKKMFLE